MPATLFRAPVAVIRLHTLQYSESTKLSALASMTRHKNGTPCGQKVQQNRTKISRSRWFAQTEHKPLRAHNYLGIKPDFTPTSVAPSPSFKKGALNATVLTWSAKYSFCTGSKLFPLYLPVSQRMGACLDIRPTQSVMYLPLQVIDLKTFYLSFSTDI